MRSKWKLPPTKYLAAGAVLAVCGTGVAEAASEKLHHMKVDGPDGEIVDVAYAGDAAPQVRIVPASTQADTGASPDEAAMAADPFVQMQRVSMMMDAQMKAMMQRAALMQRNAAALQTKVLQEARMTTTVNGQEVQPGFTMTGTLPEGVQVRYYSSSTDASGCTRTVSYASDGSGAKPKMVQAASDSCAADTGASRVVPAKAERSGPVVAPADAPAGRDGAHTV